MKNNQEELFEKILKGIISEAVMMTHANSLPKVTFEEIKERYFLHVQKLLQVHFENRAELFIMDELFNAPYSDANFITLHNLGHTLGKDFPEFNDKPTKEQFLIGDFFGMLCLFSLQNNLED